MMVHESGSSSSMKSKNSKYTTVCRYLLATLFLLACFPSSRVFSFVPTSRFVRIHNNRNHPQSLLTTLYGSKKTGPKKRSGKPRARHEKWQPYFDKLSKYVSEHGHCNVKEEENPLLYNWVQEQQQSYIALQMGRKTKLTKKRAVALEQLGVLSSVDMDNAINEAF